MLAPEWPALGKYTRWWRLSRAAYALRQGQRESRASRPRERSTCLVFFRMHSSQAARTVRVRVLGLLARRLVSLDQEVVRVAHSTQMAYRRVHTVSSTCR